MDAAGLPIEATAADDSCSARSGSRTFLLGLPPFFVRRRGTRLPSPSVLSWGSSYLVASSSPKEKGDVGSSSAAASSHEPPVEMGRRCGGGCGQCKGNRAP
ncbi:hypothetical protein EJB05_51128, partial [Eragrostis curvula]